MHLAITDKIPNRNKLVPEFVLSLLLVNRLREEYYVHMDHEKSV